jgi:UDP-N-acetylglucosamine transferase subunit ALG13
VKIFATVGTQLPFDRLIRELDAWTESNSQCDVVAQIGLSSYEPRHMRWDRMVPEKRFREYLGDCDAIVAHAGMGTIISAIENGKHVIVMPRRAEYGEHRNDHQLATAKRLRHLQGLAVVHNGPELAEALEELHRSRSCSGVSAKTPLRASPQLISEIRHFAGLEAH